MELKLETAGGKWWVADPTGILKPATARLGVLSAVYSPSSGQWVVRDARPENRAGVQGILDAANAGRVPADDPMPKANASRVELVEANGRVYVSGPRHVMQEHVNPRLKSQGFTFDYGTNLWSLNASALTPIKRRNLEKIIAPYTSGGGGDMRSPKKIQEDELSRRRGLGLGTRIPFELKDEAKRRGGLWEDSTGKWYLPDAAALQEVRDLYEKTPARVAEREIARRKSEGLGVRPPYEQKDLAKGRGGLWDPDTKTWYMPDAASKAAVLAELRALEESAREVARRHTEEKREREQAELQRQGLRYLYVPGTSRGDHPAIGRTFRDRKTGELVTVVEVKSTYYPEDGLSFGLPDDRGYMHRLTVRPADAAERDPVEKAEAEALSRREALRRRAELARDIQKRGEIPPGPVDLRREGRLLLNGRDSLAYGGGDWFVLTGSHVWYVQNNGSDGDDWGRNNVTTGGAGAVGWRVPQTPDLEEEIRRLDSLVGERL